MKRHVKLKCKNCETEMFEGVYTAAEWTELRWMMEQTKHTACCGLFQYGDFPVKALVEDENPEESLEIDVNARQAKVLLINSR